MIAHFDAGLLKHRLTFYNSQYDENGEFDENDQSNSFSVWGHIAPLTSQPMWDADSHKNIINYSITIRWIESFSTHYQIICNERRFKILSAFDPDERRNWLVIKCEEYGN